MKRFFLAASFIFLILSWTYADADDFGPISCDVNFCYYVDSVGNVRDTDGNSIVFSGATVKKIIVQNGIYGGKYFFWTSETESPYSLTNYPAMGFGTQTVTGVLDATVARAGNTVITKSDRVFARYYDGDLFTTLGSFKSAANKSDYFEGNVFSVDPSGNFSEVAGGGYDNVRITYPTGPFSTAYIAKKTDGTLVTDVPGVDVSGLAFKDCSAYKYSGYGSTRFVCVKTDGTLYANGMSVPSGQFRDVSMSGNGDRICAASVPSNDLKCWDSTGNFLTVTGSVTNLYPTPVPPSTVTYADGLTCVTNQFPNLQEYSTLSGGFMNVGGEIARWKEDGKSPYGCLVGGLQCGDVRYLVNTSEDGTDQDLVAAFNYGSGTYLDQESFQDPELSTAKSKLIPNFSYKPPVLSMGATRGGEAFNANVWLFYGVTNVSEKQPWAYFVDRENPAQVYPMFASGGIASAFLLDGKYYDLIRMTNVVSSPKGTSFIRGTSFSPNTSCSIGNNECGWDFYGTTPVCKGVLNDAGYVGQCEKDSQNRCVPMKNGSGSYLPGLTDSGVTTEYDSDGNVVGRWRKADPVQGNKINAGNLFDCSDLPDGFGGIWPCMKRIGQNIVTMVSSSADSSVGTAKDLNKELQKPSTVTGSTIELGTRAETETNNPANKFAQKGWNKAFDKTDPYIRLTWMQFSFALMMFMLLLLVAFASINKSEE